MNRRRLAAVISTLVAAAAMNCAGAQRVPDLGAAVAGGDQILVQVVAPFEVRDSAGTPYAHPFLGGLNIPRPQLIDIDGDGDLDLFAQEYSDDLMFFENVGTPENSHYLWRTNRYEDLAVGEWYRFVDMDGDEDFDLLAEQPFSLIRYYRNDGTRTSPLFVVVADTLRGATGEPLFSDRQNIPNVTDIDCDGLLDLFVGRLTGTVMRYEETGRDEFNTPLFSMITDRFEDIEIVAQIGSVHGANTMAFVDIDQDGDQDLFWGDFFEPGVLLIENTGSCAQPSLRGEPVSFPVNEPIATSGYNAPAFGDLDADGDIDLLVGVLGGAFNPNRTTIDNFYYLEHEGDLVFTIRSRRLTTNVDVGSESNLAFGDLDQDGDLDLLVGNKIEQGDPQQAGMYYFENTGEGRSPTFAFRGPWIVTPSYSYAPALGDLDGDEDLDMLLGTWRADLQLYRNQGSESGFDFVLVDSSLVKLTRGSYAKPTLVDIDGDADLDLFVGEQSGTINFYRNVGTTQSPSFELVSDEFLDIDVGQRSSPTFVDIDLDGDLDLIIGTEKDGLMLYRNEGSPEEPSFVGDRPLNVTVPPYASPTFVDIDADGDDDLFVGGIGGGIMFFVNRRITD